MGFSLESGYTPKTIEEIINGFITNINAEFGTTYTYETFIGTNMYKYFYAVAQMLQKNEVKTAEIFLKLQDYFKFTNEMIIDPKVTPQGIVSVFKEKGYTASVKPVIEVDAGEVDICVDVDDEDEDYESVLKPEIAGIIKDYIVAGVITQGTETETIVLSNGQSFDFSFHLPARKETHLRLTITTSRNNLLAIPSPDSIKETLLANINNLYSLGLDFEPERYYTTADAPYAGDIKLEYSFDAGTTWLTEVYHADFDDLLEFSLENTEIVEN